MSEWVSVKDRLPVAEQTVLVSDDGDVFACTYTEDAYIYQGGSGGPKGFFTGNYFDSFGDDPIMAKSVNYWMPLPPPPEQESE